MGSSVFHRIDYKQRSCTTFHDLEKFLELSFFSNTIPDIALLRNRKIPGLTHLPTNQHAKIPKIFCSRRTKTSNSESCSGMERHQLWLQPFSSLDSASCLTQGAGLAPASTLPLKTVNPTATLAALTTELESCS